MLLVDVNVLLYAFREDAPRHDEHRRWLQQSLGSDERLGVADLVLSSFLRIATHPRIFNPPTPLDAALAFAAALRGQPNCALVAPGPRHWEIFTQLCRETGATGNLVPDAYLAALAIELGCEWITTDTDFQAFPGLRWRHPLR
jgi:toxin-antitoxin system PIN domain toxin